MSDHHATSKRESPEREPKCICGLGYRHIEPDCPRCGWTPTARERRAEAHATPDRAAIKHGRYEWGFSGYHGGEAWLDISRDQGGWSGCGHPDTLDFTRAELVAVLERLDAEIAEVRARDE